MTSVDGFITSCKDKYMSTGCISSPFLKIIYSLDISQPFLVVVMFCCNRFIVAQLAVIKLCNKVIPQVATLIQHHLSFLKSPGAFYLHKSTISHQNNNTPLKFTLSTQVLTVTLFMSLGPGASYEKYT